MIRLACLLLGLSLGAQAVAAEPDVNFSTEIQPIFAKRCYKCHGPAEAEGGLRLNSFPGVTAELESGERAVVPGVPAQSAILDRLRSTDETLRMPPEGKPLTPEEITLVERWIKTGANWSSHWVYQPLERPAVPTPKQSAWVRQPIDAFVLHRLEAAGLSPAKPADRVALLRRVYYDLIGLPPAPEQVDRFLADQSPRAFETVVDQLLDSPQYGEKWGRHWLDLVRYADTNGYERDGQKELIWKYRDYVIRSFNEDKPYDRFVREQLAGDELPDRTGDSITATGFYRLGLWDDEPADRELARYDYLDDILRTSSETFLGMTLGCARCHDHKIDPVTQKDYYAMLSFFGDISPHGAGKTNHVPISSAQDQADFAARAARKEQREKMLTQQIADLETEFLKQLKIKHPDLEIGPAKLPGQAHVDILADSVKTGQEWEYTTARPAENWFQIAFDDREWKKGAGGFGTRGTPGAVVRTEWNSRDIWLRRDFGLESLPGRLTLNIHHDEDAAVYLNGTLIAEFKGYLTAYKQVELSMAAVDLLQTGRNTLAIHCRQTGGGQYIDAGLIGDFSLTSAVGLARQYGEEILGRDKLAEWQQLRRTLAASQAEKLEPKTEFVMAVAEQGRRTIHILGRGNPGSPGDPVAPAFPQILDPPAAEVPADYGTKVTSGKRRRLAEWMTAADNPLTARVIVNRVWQYHFGRGLVPSSSDFGFQGTPPTHPELLDWLASEFIQDGWKFKALHKKILLSATWQMSSESHPAALAQDPTNTLFWRFDMRRLTAEELRDSILAVTGTLNREMYGPGVFPPLPPSVLATSSNPGGAWGNSPPDQAARRTIYVQVKRSLRPPLLSNFDAADTDAACAVRLTTTVPTQALGMLNSEWMNEQAAKLASRLEQEHPDDELAQVRRAIRLTAGRPPGEDEVRDDLKFIHELRTTEKLSHSEALRLYALLILNTNEFVYLD